MKTVEEMQSMMFDINAELDACMYGFNYLYEELFGGIKPSPEYIGNFKEFQSMFWLFTDTLGRFAGKYSLLMGEGDTPHIKCEFEQIKDLYDMNTPAAEQRKKIKTELTSPPAEAADESSVGDLKAVLKKLLELDSEQESFVQSIAMKTEGFSKITKDQCDQLIAGVKEMLAAYDTQEG